MLALYVTTDLDKKIKLSFSNDQCNKWYWHSKNYIAGSLKVIVLDIGSF